MTNAERFLDAFARIERRVKRLAGARPTEAFSAVLGQAARANSAVRRYQDDLREFAELRNALVHRRAGGDIIAEPHDSVTAEIEHIAELVTAPPPAMRLFARRVRTIDERAPLTEALAIMRREGFAQIPVQRDGRFQALLTADVLTRWLTASVENGFPDLGAVSVGDVCVYARDAEWDFLPRTASVFDALERFRRPERVGRRLYALLITEHGRANEGLLGIITVADLPRALAAVDGE